MGVQFFQKERNLGLLSEKGIFLPIFTRHIEQKKFSTETLMPIIDRSIALSHVENVRDLGGIPTTDGRVVRPGLLFRGANLAKAKGRDLAALRDLGIGTVVDFRTPLELKGRVDRELEGARMVSHPVYIIEQDSDDMKEAASHMRDKKQFNVKKLIVVGAFHRKVKEVAGKIYPNLLNNHSCQKAFGDFLRMVLECDRPVFFHCTQGKDRVGVASALILSALGVSREEIIKDFELTNEFYSDMIRKIKRRIRFLGGKEEEMKVVDELIGGSVENFRRALEDIDRRFGDIQSYIVKVLGFGRDEIERLREKYTAPSHA